MQLKLTAPLLLLLASPLSSLTVSSYPYLVPRSPVSSLLPSNYQPSYGLTPYRPPSYLPYGANARVICSGCSCDDDFFCAFNCLKCSSDSFCSSCNCLTSLGCARNCDSCKQPAQDQPNASCEASSGPAKGKKCIFPFIYNGDTFNGCTQLYGGLANVYSPVFWCSTKVDINGYHVRSDRGQHVGFCNDSCPKALRRFFF